MNLLHTHFWAAKYGNSFKLLRVCGMIKIPCHTALVRNWCRQFYESKEICLSILISLLASFLRNQLVLSPQPVMRWVRSIILYNYFGLISPRAHAICTHENMWEEYSRKCGDKMILPRDQIKFCWKSLLSSVIRLSHARRMKNTSLISPKDTLSFEYGATTNCGCYSINTADCLLLCRLVCKNLKLKNTPKCSMEGFAS